MGVDADCISIKATTNEKLGYIGREEGVACYAVVLLKNIRVSSQSTLLLLKEKEFGG
jgi:2C-methyl-D-erythritol 2,4-cyclodiphosphate synthase